jgi:hypothetical protein
MVLGKIGKTLIDWQSGILPHHKKKYYKKAPMQMP